MPWRAIALACLDDDHLGAADLYAKAGSPTSEARLRLRAAEDLAAGGRLDESRVQAKRALDFHRKVGATRYIELERQILEGFA